jgi:hypothetical protein
MGNINDTTVACNGYLVADLDATVANDVDILFDAGIIPHPQLWHSSGTGLLYFQSSTIPNEDSVTNMNKLGIRDELRWPQNRPFAEMTEEQPVEQYPFHQVKEITAPIRVVKESSAHGTQWRYLRLPVPLTIS